MCSVPLLYDSVLSGPSPPINIYTCICNGIWLSIAMVQFPIRKKNPSFLPRTLWNEKPPLNRLESEDPPLNENRKASIYTLNLHCFEVITLPKFNSSPLKSYLPNRKVVFHPPFCFRGYVKLRGCIFAVPQDVFVVSCFWCA